jgi:predicted hydrocarbon binding protein
MQFEFDTENGIIKDKVTGERCIIIIQARMQEIFDRLSAIFQSGAKVIFFEAGKAAAERFVEDRPEMIKADKRLFAVTVVSRFTDAGLGKIEITDFDPEKAVLKFRIWNNFFAEFCGGEESACCSCVEGFVSGLYEQIMGKTPIIKRTNCVVNGDPCCKWQMASK